MSFGHALYYPHIHLTNKNWLKHSFLFWDKISRIVPQSFKPEDSEEVIKMKQETNFIQDYHPESWVTREAFHQFAKLLKNYVNETETPRRMHREDRNRQRLFHNRTLRNGSYIHIEKMDYELKEILFELGLAIPGQNKWTSWLKVDNEIGDMYMTYLAKSISKDKSIPIVTDNEDLYISKELVSNYNYNHQFEEKLGCLLIDAVMPKNINNVTVDQLIEIRNKYDDQRISFFNKVNELSSVLPDIDNKSALEDALNIYSKKLAYDTADLKKIYDSNGIDSVIKPLAISAPTSIVSLSNYIPIEYQSLGFSAGILFGVVSYINELKENHREAQKDPMAYLLSIHSELNREGLFHNIKDRLSGQQRY
jgi:hypothetical protein